jgi:hypothetical protein
MAITGMLVALLVAMSSVPLATRVLVFGTSMGREVHQLAGWHELRAELHRGT